MEMHAQCQIQPLLQHILLQRYRCQATVIRYALEALHNLLPQEQVTINGAQLLHCRQLREPLFLLLQRVQPYIM